ncbi:hypothetical protein AVEN_33213-1 [Araneus ventricosus]|uniref:Uncharacterized protein n=1 Tax=Araneus ventricosus TaxID=182803 RepID=A0A4Y2S9G4_ARAVE|nr:hypothetical protein AVEN_33213-1 [Araneus ventricosus]
MIISVHLINEFPGMAYQIYNPLQCQKRTCLTTYSLCRKVQPKPARSSTGVYEKLTGPFAIKSSPTCLSSHGPRKPRRISRRAQKRRPAVSYVVPSMSKDEKQESSYCATPKGSIRCINLVYQLTLLGVTQAIPTMALVACH